MPVLVLGKNALPKIGVNGTVKKSTQLTQILPMFTLLMENRTMREPISIMSDGPTPPSEFQR